MKPMTVLAAFTLMMIAFVPSATAQTEPDGPLGTCTGLVDAYCKWSRDPCDDTPGASCRLDYCIVYVSGTCPITRNEILDLIGS